MNKRQKEVEAAKLSAEEKELKHLKAIYNKASEDIQKKIRISDGKINFLLSEFDNLDDEQKSVLQSQIYQRRFQESLQKQIDGFTASLNSGQYKSINEYLKGCYETGYIGTMYDIAGQGIPLIMPIDQKKVTRAMTHNTKLSTTLYKRLGVDLNLLKKRIANNISRGIATASEYRVIARNIAADSNVGFNRSMRIARTEGHRIQIESAVDAQHAAKDAGADIVKQWDASLDGRTRPHHRMLDGQIRELDEAFEVDGMKVMHPSGFGRASEDINCRCALLQRARWALDEEELNTLKERAAYYGLDKTKDFDDYRKKYLKTTKATKAAAKATATKNKKVASKATTSNAASGKIQLDVNNYSDAFTSRAAEKKNTQMLVDYVNGLQDTNQTTLKLYSSIGKIENFSANGIKFSISHGKNHAVSYTYNPATGQLLEVKLIIPKLSGENLIGQVQTTLHEQMHLIDMLLKSDPTKAGAYFGEAFEPLQKALKNTSSSIGEDIKKLFDDARAEYEDIRKKARQVLDDEHDEIVAKYLPNGAFGAGADYKTYKKEYNRIKKKFEETVDYEQRNALGGGICQLEDIYDALSGGYYRDSGVVRYGHGGSYYRKTGKVINEIVANYASLSVTRPDLIDLLKKDKPELVKALDEMLEEMVKKV